VVVRARGVEVGVAAWAILDLELLRLDPGLILPAWASRLEQRNAELSLRVFPGPELHEYGGYVSSSGRSLSFVVGISVLGQGASWTLKK